MDSTRWLVCPPPHYKQCKGSSLREIGTMHTPVDFSNTSSVPLLKSEPACIVNTSIQARKPVSVHNGTHLDSEGAVSALNSTELWTVYRQ